jgi:hypothetical protein
MIPLLCSIALDWSTITTSSNVMLRYKHKAGPATVALSIGSFASRRECHNDYMTVQEIARQTL